MNYIFSILCKAIPLEYSVLKLGDKWLSQIHFYTVIEGSMDQRVIWYSRKYPVKSILYKKGCMHQTPHVDGS